MKMSEIHDLGEKELVEKIESERGLLQKQKLNHIVSPLDNPMTIRSTRRNIARLETILRQRKSK